MFRSHYAAKAIYDTASGTAEVVAAVGDRIDRRFVPQGVNEATGDVIFLTPFIVYRMIEPSIDDGPFGQAVNAATCRFEVAIYDDAGNTERIIDAANALDTALQTMNLLTDGVQITARRESELPDLDPDYGLPFVRVGGTYALDVT